MFALARDVHSATGVELAVSCYFFSAASPEKNLVVASINCIRVYRLATYGDVEDDKTSTRGDAAKDATAIDVTRKAKLECMAKYDLFGEIADLAVVKFAGSSRDSLVICFRDAKASVVEYDPYTHSLKTVSLHYFEEEAVANGWTENHYIPRVVVDPENRAAAISFFGSKIAVIPFRKDVLGTAGAGAQAQANATADGESTDEMPSPVMTSYIIDLKTVDSKMDYVIDLQFLHGYYEPTLLVLFEPLRTYSGRVMLRPDTCQMVAMSLNTADGSHPVIWSVGGLPFDCMQAIPVARPIGGCLIVAVNSLIYLNQSMPPYGVAVNCIPATTTGFPLKPLTQEGVTLAMDCARSAFMKEPDVLALSVANGDLWVITLISDGMMAVRGFHFDKAATAVVATCLSVVEQGFMFVGSRLGNSQLLRYIPKDQVRLDIVKKEALLTNGPSSVAEKEVAETDAKEEDEKSEDGPPTKKKRKQEGKSDSLADWVASGVDELDDADEVEVYFGPEEDGTAKGGTEVAGVKTAEQILSFANFATGEGQSVVNQIVNYAFESCDSLINIGPCGKLSLGQPAFLSQEFWSNDRHDLDLLTSSGYGKGGALCVMHRSLRPQVITTFELPGCVDMWTVVGEKSNGFHSFLIMSLVNSSMVLETGVELNEVESGGFVTSKPTVYACNIGNNRFIVQVTAFSMVLLRGKDVVHTTQVDIKNPIILARVADPYLVLLGAGGEVKLAKLMEPRGTAKAYMDVVAGLPIQQSRAVAISTFTDLSGMFAAAGPGYSGVTPAGVTPRAAAGLEVELDGPGATVDGAEATSSLFETGGELLDEDELLYGESDSILLTAFTEKQDAASGSKPKQKRTNGAPLVTQWLFLVRQNGNLEIYSLPDFSTKFLARGFALAPYVLTNSMTDTWVESRIHDVPQVKEILVVGLGLTKGAGKSPASLKPMMFAFVGDDLLIYEAFPFFEGRSIDDPYIKVRFRKIEHDYIAHPNATGRPIVKQEKGTYNASRLIYFSEIGASASYSGVFVSGVYPHWALMGARGDMKIHPMSIDGPVKCFAPFHNVNCPNGFLYFNHKEEMRICLMPAQMNYDCSWPTRKVPLKSTPRFLVYHVETKTYAVATSSETESHTMYKFNGEDKELVEEIRPENFPLPYVTSFALQLFSPVSWDVIPETKIPMEEYEHITDMKNVALIYEGAASGLKGYIGIATNFIYGEDITCRGRILIMDILDVVPEPGRPLTRNKMKQLYGKEQKGPVTAIAAVKGFLVSAIGQKIYIWQLKDNDLVGIAFIDTQIYTHQMICLKNFILVADMVKSITLLQFQEKYRTICVVARDIHPLEVYGVEFFVCDKTLGFVASDRERNLAVFAYQPEARENSGVSRLVRRADVHIGSNINQMFRIKAKASDPSGCLRPGQPKFGDKRQITWYGTLDGALGYLLPLHEVQYRVLITVQNVLHTLMPHLGGLNPKGHRTYRSAGRRGPLGNVNPARNVVDGNLVFKYLHLPLPDKLEVTKRTGMPIEDIVDVLQECARVTDHF